jgi:hypothetical protein
MSGNVHTENSGGRFHYRGRPLDGQQTKAERFRKKAHDARADAAQMGAREAREALLRIAEDYERLAQHAEPGEPK